MSADTPLATVFGGSAFAGAGHMPLPQLLAAKRLMRLKDLISVAPWELRDWLLVTEDQAAEILQHAWAACAATPVSAWDLDTECQSSHVDPATAHQTVAPLPTLGAALGSNGLSGSLVEVAGPPSVGKTQFCLHAAALAAAAGGEVFWLDTERTFSAPRLLELLESMALTAVADEPRSPGMAALQRIRHRVCTSLEELQTVVAELAQRARQGSQLPALVVLDSVASVARVEGDATESRKTVTIRRASALSRLASLLKVLVSPPVPSRSLQHNLSRPPGVVVTNQVMGDPTLGGSRVTLGNVWHHAVNWRLVLSHLPPGGQVNLGLKEQADPSGRRYLHVEKSPCSPQVVVPFCVGAAGLREL